MRYAAFLRAINVGKHNRIRMEDLRRNLGAAGFQNPKTHLQSGNVWFDSPNPDAEELAVRFEAVLAAMGCRGADAMVRSLEQMRAIQALEPFAQTPPEHYQFAVFLRRSIDEIKPGHPKLEVLHSTGLEVFVQLDKSTSAQKISSILKTKTPNTVRYWNVVQELYRLM